MIKFLMIISLVGVAIAQTIPNVSVKSRFPDGRIVGGNDTSIDKVPYQVSIMANGAHYCGGSIIARDLVLTAAHCAVLPRRYYTVHAGSSYSYTGGSVHRVLDIFVHKQYFQDISDVPSNDIALFRMKTDFVFDRTRQPIEMYKSGEETKVGIYAIITGWGITSNGTTPRILQTVSIPIISKDACKKAYANLTVVNPGQICAAYPQGGKDACQGDSGGPLVVGGRLAGIVSWGSGCALPGRPGVYTEVAYFRNWINNATKFGNNTESSTKRSPNLGTITICAISYATLTLTTTLTLLI